LPCSHLTRRDDSVFENARLEPFSDQADDARIADPMLQETDKPFLANRVERILDTLPTITSTVIPSRCGLSGHDIRWRANP
jgi:hypothetical protein